VNKADVLRDPNYWHRRAEEVRAMADYQDDVVAKSQMIDKADKYDMMAERAPLQAAALGRMTIPVQAIIFGGWPKCPGAYVRFPTHRKVGRERSASEGPHQSQNLTHWSVFRGRESPNYQPRAKSIPRAVKRP
jgi:hypothetical protein